MSILLILGHYLVKKMTSHLLTFDPIFDPSIKTMPNIYFS